MTTEVNKKKIIDFFGILEKNTRRVEITQADKKIKYVFARYLFDLYSVQLGRIAESDVCDKERYYIEAFELFFQAFQKFLFDKANLSNINMILTYMNRIEEMTDLQMLEQKKYDWNGSIYNWGELKQVFLRQHIALVSDILRKLPLDKNILIGIYGIGKHTERMLDTYRRYIGPITANLIFLDSNMPSHTAVFGGCDVLNIKDISEELDLIIISSYRYQNEMDQKLKSMKVKTNIIRFYINAEDTFDFFI